MVYGADADAIRALAEELAGVGAKACMPSCRISRRRWCGRRVRRWRGRVEDVLARRTRALFLNARAAVAMAEPVAGLLAAELGRDGTWAAAQVEEFRALAKQYMV